MWNILHRSGARSASLQNGEFENIPAFGSVESRGLMQETILLIFMGTLRLCAWHSRLPRSVEGLHVGWTGICG